LRPHDSSPWEEEVLEEVVRQNISYR